jgi:hypothetical protein
MAITTISHTVCLDCSENEFVVTGSLDGGSIVAFGTNSLSVTDPNGNVVVYDNATIGDDLYTAPFTYTVSAGSTIISGSGSVSAATLNWTAAANTTYSFILRTMVNGYVQDYPLSYSTGSSFTATEIGNGIEASVNALPSGLGLQNVNYTSGTSLTIQGQTNYYFGIDGLLNLTASVISPSPSGSSSATFSDGKYTVTWSLTDNSITHSSVTESYFLCDVECCVRGKMSAIDIDCDCTGDKATDAAIESMLMLQGIKAAAACGKDAKAQKLLVGLQAICNNECKSC